MLRMAENMLCNKCIKIFLHAFLISDYSSLPDLTLNNLINIYSLLIYNPNPPPAQRKKVLDNKNKLNKFIMKLLHFLPPSNCHDYSLALIMVEIQTIPLLLGI